MKALSCRSGLVTRGALRWVCSVFALLTAHAAAAPAEEAPSVIPYRPSLSTPAELPAPGWLELEAGLQREHAGPARRDSLAYALKLAFTPDWGVLLLGEARVREDDGSGQRITGGGDSGFVLKRRFALDAASAFGLEAGATLATGRAGIRRTGTDYTLTGIYSTDAGRYHADVNLGATRIGAPDAGTGRVQALWAVALSTSLNDTWSVVGELSGTRRNGVDHTAQVLVAAGYSVSKSLALDAGLVRGLRSGESNWSLLVGLTVHLARLF